MIFRADHKENYTRLNNQLIRDENLSNSAYRLLLFMLSCQDDWAFSLKGLAKQTKWTERKLARIVNELKKAGYIEQRQQFDENGKFRPAVWDIYEEPKHGLPKTGTPSPTVYQFDAERAPRKASPTHSVKLADIRTNKYIRTNNVKEQIKGKEKIKEKTPRENSKLIEQDWEKIAEQAGGGERIKDMLRLIRIIQNAYPYVKKNQTADDIAQLALIYQEAFAGVSVETIERAVRHCIETSKWQPTVAEIKNAITWAIYTDRPSVTPITKANPEPETELPRGVIELFEEGEQEK